MRKPASGFLTRSDKNWAVQPQRLKISDLDSREVVLYIKQK